MVSWPQWLRHECGSIPPQIGIVNERGRERAKKRERPTLRDRQTEKGHGGSEEREREREREMGEERQTD